MNIFRKITALSAAVLLGVSVCGAQSLKVAKIGETVTEGGTRYVLPSTTIVVDVTVRHEKVYVGEYARYAQKYLGVIAPLADKDIYTVESAKIQWFDTDNLPDGNIEPVAEGAYEFVTHIEPGAEFMRVLPDKVSVSAKNGDDAAREAANMIYNIRKRRVELIMGDIGENIYGEGLRAAIERMDKIENEYLELFLGKQSFTTYTKRFYVVPEAGKSTYVVCRMNQSKGLVPAADLSGEPVVLEMRPQGLAKNAYPAVPVEDTPKKGGAKAAPAPTAQYMVADVVDCTVTDSKKAFAFATVPVYQMGARVSR